MMDDKAWEALGYEVRGIGDRLALAPLTLLSVI